jgi:hypothetical protein
VYPPTPSSTTAIRQTTTTTSQDARWSDTAGILADVADRQLAEQSLDRLMELSPEMRGGAILAPGEVLAASGDGTAWGEAASSLLAAADAGGEPAEQVHVATEAGEVFALRDGDLTAVAVTERFVLASLMVFDMRAVIRDLAAGGADRDGSNATGEG